MSISANYVRIRQEVTDYVTIVISAKARTNDETEDAIEEGSNMVRIGTAVF